MSDNSKLIVLAVYLALVNFVILLLIFGDIAK